MELETPLEDIVDYIDFASICEDYELETGDITPGQFFTLKQVLEEYVSQNKTVDGLQDEE
jgi:hypothetical protein